MKSGDLVRIRQTGFVGLVIGSSLSCHRQDMNRWLIRLAVTMKEAEFLEKDLEIIYEADKKKC